MVVILNIYLLYNDILDTDEHFEFSNFFLSLSTSIFFFFFFYGEFGKVYLYGSA